MKYKVTLNNKIYEVEVEEGKAILLDEYEAISPKAVQAEATPSVSIVEKPVIAEQPKTAVSENAVLSPLPGTVLSIKAKEGNQVKAGDVILVIEAMKMENEIAAPADGTLIKLHVETGANVNTGSPLFEII